MRPRGGLHHRSGCHVSGGAGAVFEDEIAVRAARKETADRPKAVAETARLARRAAALGRGDAVALARSAHALAFIVGDLDAATPFSIAALCSIRTCNASGWVRVYGGEPEVAIEHFARAVRLSSLDPQIIAMHAGTAFAHLLAGPMTRHRPGRKKRCGSTRIT